VSFIHYEPDPAVVPCLGCNELVREPDLVKQGLHYGKSTFFWHPYHFWCIRDRPPRPNPKPTCADCGRTLIVEQMRAVLRWGMTRERRLDQRRILAAGGQPIAYDNPEAAVPRPHGLRLVAVTRTNTNKPLPPEPKWDPVLDEHERDYESHLRGLYEIVHDACPDDEPRQWRTQLRAAPDDADLRVVYADWLEQEGERARAELARLVVARHRDIASMKKLHALRKELPGSWIRDVVGAL
jgi:uncharacterized protein (TIGR02996 family)